MRRIHFDSTDSTNLQARLAAAAYPGETLLVTATEQTAGRGRQGRQWHSPRGGVWMSVAWPTRRGLAQHRPTAYGGASLAAAVAVRRAVCAAAPDIAAELAIKWPNDLLLRNRKVAGILCEQLPASAKLADAAGLLIVGVGVNAHFDLDDLPGSLRQPATSLRAELGRGVPVEPLTTGIAAELVAAIEALERDGLTARVLDEVRSHLAGIGEVRNWLGPEGPTSGRVLGIDGAGRLVLGTARGDVSCSAGEIAASIAPA